MILAVHTTSLAAAYHLNILSESNQIPSREEILAVPYFNKLQKKMQEDLFFMGKIRKAIVFIHLADGHQKLPLKHCSTFVRH